MVEGNGNSNGNGARVGTERVKQGLAQMLKGGVIVRKLVFAIPAPWGLCSCGLLSIEWFETCWTDDAGTRHLHSDSDGVR